MIDYERLKIYKDVPSLKEKDILNPIFSNMTLRFPAQTYVVIASRVGRPDLIAYDVYNDHAPWWILMRVNKIEDVWNDLEEGVVLLIPDIQDIKDIYSKLAGTDVF